MQLICCGQRICEGCSLSRLKQLSQCPFCSEPGTPKARHDRGFKRELDRLQINCPRCKDGWSGSFKDLPAHLKNHYDLVCDNCDQKFVFPQQLQKHQHESCANRPIACILSVFGCDTKIPFNKLSQHYLTEQHQIALNKFVRQVRSPSSRKNIELQLQNSLNENYLRLLNDCHEKIVALSSEMDPVISNCDRLKAERERIEEDIKKLRAEFLKTKDLSDKSTKFIEDFQQILTNMYSILDEIKSKSVSGPRLISLDSTFVFKLNLIALMNSVQVMQSDIFFTAQSGYKIALVCQQYMDEQTKKRFISVCFTIFEGEFDAILLWPFIYPITIKILDLVGTKKDITYTIPYDHQLESFKQPAKNGTSQFVIKEFCAVDSLIEHGNTYLQDGFIYLQTDIDFTVHASHQNLNRASSKIINDPIQNNILSNMMVK